MDHASMKYPTRLLAASAVAVVALLTPIAAAAADADAAQALARQNNCFKCHAVETKKVGPSWKEVAAKLKGDEEAQVKLIKHLTTGPNDHPVIKAKSPEDTKNLVDWILSL